ncbi:MAG: hypothetical protein WDO12_03315 [Pseudomonadota bacterium]
MKARARIGILVATLPFVASSTLAQTSSHALPVEEAQLAHPGPYKVVQETTFGLPGHIVFRPVDLDRFPRKDTLPVMVWANGGCASDSSPYFAFLTTVASHGFLVLATTQVGDVSDPYWPGPGAATYDRITLPVRAALDWTESENARDASPLKGKIAIARMAAMGVSCGGGIAIMAGSDRRIGTVGAFSDPSWGSVHLNGDPKDVHLSRLHGPVLILNGGESDGALAGSTGSFEAINHVPVFYGSRHNAGHMGTLVLPGGGEFANVVSSWLEWTLKDDTKAGAMFLGSQCELCVNPNWDTRSKRLEAVRGK